MALTVSRGQGAGAYYILIAKRDSNGYPVGQVADTETIANTTTMQPLYIDSLIDFTPETPTEVTLTNFGGQRVISQTTLGTNSLGTATFQLSEYDERLIPLLNNSVLDVVEVDGFAETAENINQSTFPRFFVMVGQRFTNTTNGADEWRMRIYHNCQVRPANRGNISQAGGENPNPTSFVITPSTSTRKLSGRVFSATTGLKVEKASDSVTIIRALYPLSFTSHKAAAADTGYVLGYRPIFATATGATNNSLTKNGTTLSATSVTIATGAIVFTAGSNADFHVALYQTRFEAI